MYKGAHGHIPSHVRPVKSSIEFVQYSRNNGFYIVENREIHTNNGAASQIRTGDLILTKDVANVHLKSSVIALQSIEWRRKRVIKVLIFAEFKPRKCELYHICTTTQKRTHDKRHRLRAIPIRCLSAYLYPMIVP